MDGVWRGGGKVQGPVVELCDRIAGGPVEARRLGSLERRHAGPDEVARLSRSRRSAGCSHTTRIPEPLGDGAQTLFDLADQLDSWVVGCSDPTP